ncbi:MAG: PspC domain-containing protein [Halanaerobiales bacterium]
MSNKKIYRSRRDRFLSGVCGGLGEYLDIDSTWIRLAFVLLALARGISVLFYIIAWIVIPEKPLDKEEETEFFEAKVSDEEAEDVESGKDKNKEIIIESDNEEKNEKKQRTIGFILVAVGGLFLFDNWYHFNWEKLWPLIIVALGFGLLVKGVRD